nr:hypothetical protein [uncultured Caproiciproducens sp.]
MTKETYIKEVIKRVKLPHTLKSRLKKDLISDIQIRQENGESIEDIIRAMGTPDEVVSELEESYIDKMPHRSRLEKIFLTCGIFLMSVLFATGIWCVSAKITAQDIICSVFPAREFISSSQAVGIIGGADGPTAIFVTSKISYWVLVIFGVILFSCIFCFAAYFILRWKRRK